MKSFFKKFFAWYERNKEANLYVATVIFAWQIVHLVWLTLDVVWLRLSGEALWQVGHIGSILIAVADYAEIPAIILATVLYATELKKSFSWKNVWFIVLINSQWLHLFWITDEVVVAQFTGASLVVLPVWLSWLGIAIDYLELPVIYDTIKKSILSLRKS